LRRIFTDELRQGLSGSLEKLQKNFNDEQIRISVANSEGWQCGNLGPQVKVLESILSLTTEDLEYALAPCKLCIDEAARALFEIAKAVLQCDALGFGRYPDLRAYLEKHADEAVKECQESTHAFVQKTVKMHKKMFTLNDDSFENEYQQEFTKRCAERSASVASPQGRATLPDTRPSDMDIKVLQVKVRVECYYEKLVRALSDAIPLAVAQELIEASKLRLHEGFGVLARDNSSVELSERLIVESATIRTRRAKLLRQKGILEKCGATLLERRDVRPFRGPIAAAAQSAEPEVDNEL